MTVQEFVVELVFRAPMFSRGVDEAQRQLEHTGAKGETAGQRVAKGMEAAAKSAGKMGRSANQATGEAARGSEAAGQKVDSLTSKFKKLAVAVGGIAAVKTAFSSYVEGATQAAQYADMFGMSMERWQGWQNVAKSVGAEAGDMADALRDMADWSSDLILNDTGPLKEFQERFGETFKDAEGNALSAEEIYLRIADIVSNMDAGEASGLLTRTGVDRENIALLQKGRKELEKYIKVGEESAIYSRRDQENAKKMREAWQAVSSVFTRISSIIISALAPAFGWIADKVKAADEFIFKHKDTIVILAGVIGTALLPALASMAAAGAAAIAPFLPFAAVIAGVVIAIDELWAFISGGSSVLEDLMRWFGATDETIEAFRDTLRSVWQWLKNVAAAVAEFWENLNIGQGIKNAANTIKRNTIDKVNAVKRFLGLGGDESDEAATPDREGTKREQAPEKGDYGRSERPDADDGERVDFGAGATGSKRPDSGRERVDFGADATGNRRPDIDVNVTVSRQPDLDASAPVSRQPDFWEKPAALTDRSAGRAEAAFSTPGAAARAGDAVRGAAARNVTNNQTNTTNISSVNIQTQATDAEGIARDFTGAMQNQAAQADGAMGL